MKVSAVVQSLLFFRGSHARGRALPFEDGPLQTPPDGGLDFEHLKRDSHEHEGYTDSPYINTTVLTDSPNPGHRGLTFHPVGAPGNFRCHYPHLDPATWESCNTADRRSCWIRSRQPGSDGRFYGYDIHSDYENAAPIGIPRYYTLDVAKHVIYPDGYPKNAILFNGTYPGPRIEACWGDQLVVTVINSLPNMGTQIHWHGLRQLFSNDMDGVPVTQCPIARGCSFVYKFRLLQYGTTWYHGHYSLQYVDGLRGPLVIHGPASSNYDLEVAETLLVTDWLYDTAFNVYAQQSMQPGARGVRADTILLNAKAGMNSIGGRGAAGPKDFAAYTVIRVVPGQRHRIRIINGAAGTAFVFSIDGHRLTVIAHDLVPIVPYITDSLVIGIGQRYDVIIGCPHGQIGNFWIRTHPADGCNQFRRGTFSSRTNPPSYPLDTRTGILSYSVFGQGQGQNQGGFPNQGQGQNHGQQFGQGQNQGQYQGHGRRSLSASSPNINTLPTTSAFPNISLSCYSHDQALHRPIVPRTVPQQPINPLSLSTFYTALQTYPSTVPFQRGNYVRWLLRLNSTKEFLSGQQMHTPFSISYSNPTLLNLTRAASNPSYNIVNYPYRKGVPGAGNEYIFMVIDSSQLLGPGPGGFGNNNNGPGFNPNGNNNNGFGNNGGVNNGGINNGFDNNGLNNNGYNNGGVNNGFGGNNNNNNGFPGNNNNNGFPGNNNNNNNNNNGFPGNNNNDGFHDGFNGNNNNNNNNNNEGFNGNNNNQFPGNNNGLGNGLNGNNPNNNGGYNGGLNNGFGGGNNNNNGFPGNNNGGYNDGLNGNNGFGGNNNNQFPGNNQFPNNNNHGGYNGFGGNNNHQGVNNNNNFGGNNNNQFPGNNQGGNNHGFGGNSQFPNNQGGHKDNQFPNNNNQGGNNNNNNFGGNNNNNQFPGPNPPFNNNNNAYFNPPISHPLHWHGHDVLLLAASPTPFDPILSPLSWNYNNPPRRDTIMVPAGGYVAVALRPNNPGVWLVHCHIAWHSSAGLALQMVIQDSPTQIHTVLGRNSTKTLYEGCHAWNRDLQRSDLPRIFDKVDSGI